jgi:hypothetical protein
MRRVSCHAELRDGSKFCDECGAPVSAQCPSCRAENRPGAKFCSECGYIREADKWTKSGLDGVGF